MVVKDIQVTHEHARPRTVKVDLDGTMPHRDHPENVVSVDMHIVVMDLLREVGHPNGIGVHVKSNKRERASMLSTVRTDEFALTEAHVGLERKPRGSAGRGVCSHPTTADVRQSYEPIEVRNL